VNRAATTIYEQTDLNQQEQHDRVVQQLTEFDDPHRTSYGDNLERISINPYPDQRLSTVLTRPHYLGTYQWTSNMAPNSVLCAFRFPEALFTLQNIQNHLKGFNFFRARVKVTLRLNTTVFHYGLLQVAWLPTHDPCAPQGGAGGVYYAPLRNIFASANSNHCYISACSRSTTEIEIPWLFGREYLRMFEPNDFLGSIGSLVVRVIIPIKLQGESNADVGLAVFAQFVDPEPVAMTIRSDHVWPTNADVGPSVVTQSGNPIEEEERRTQDGPLSSILCRTKKYVVGVRSMVNNVFDGGLQALSGVQKMFQSVGLSAPSDVRPALQALPTPFKNLSVTNSVDNSSRLTMNIDQKISESSVYCGPDELAVFANWCKHWWLLRLGSFLGTYSAGTRIIRIPVGPNVAPTPMQLVTEPFLDGYDLTHYNWYTNLCRYWRGSMKYRIRFIASKFATCRVLLTWEPGVLNTPLPAGRPLEGDMVSKVVDICGDTQVEFMIPYLQSEPWKEVGPVRYDPDPEFTNGLLAMYVVNPVATSAGDDTETATIAFIIEAAPCADIQLAVPCGLSTWYSLEAIELQSGEGLGPNISSSFDEGACFGDPVTSVYQLAHRYYYTGDNACKQLFSPTSAQAFGAVVQDPVRMDVNSMNFLTLLMAPWALHRGSVRWVFHGAALDVLRVYNYFVKENSSASVLPCQAICNAGMELQTRLRGGAIQVELPYYNHLYNSTLGSQYNGIKAPDLRRECSLSTRESANAFNSYASNGDNYSLGVPIAPPRIYYKPPVS